MPVTPYADDARRLHPPRAARRFQDKLTGCLGTLMEQVGRGRAGGSGAEGRGLARRVCRARQAHA